MKKIMMICLFVLGISAVSYAQGGGRQRMTTAYKVKAMKDYLKITNDQAAKITVIYDAQKKSMDSLRNAGGDMRTQMRPMMQATTDKVKAVLTLEQAAAWQKQMDEARA